VSCSPAFRWFVAVLLVLTLGWKSAEIAYGRTSAANEPEEKVAERQLSAFLVNNHFQIVQSREVVFGMQLVVAITPVCQLRVALSSSRGWHRDLIKNMSADAADTFVVFGGRIYPEQPMLRTVPDFLWSRFLNGFGLPVRSASVFTVLAGNNCAARQLPWKELM
jgi:hypothetical protein